jgi:hypothetical protein
LICPGDEWTGKGKADKVKKVSPIGAGYTVAQLTEGGTRTIVQLFTRHQFALRAFNEPIDNRTGYFALDLWLFADDFETGDLLHWSFALP